MAARTQERKIDLTPRRSIERICKRRTRGASFLPRLHGCRNSLRHQRSCSEGLERTPLQTILAQVHRRKLSTLVCVYVESGRGGGGGGVGSVGGCGAIRSRELEGWGSGRLKQCGERMSVSYHSSNSRSQLHPSGGTSTFEQRKGMSSSRRAPERGTIRIQREKQGGGAKENLHSVELKYRS